MNFIYMYNKIFISSVVVLLQLGTVKSFAEVNWDRAPSSWVSGPNKVKVPQR